MVVKQGQGAASTHFRTRSFPGWLGHKPIPSPCFLHLAGRVTNKCGSNSTAPLQRNKWLFVSPLQWPRSTGRGTQGLGWGQGDEQRLDSDPGGLFQPQGFRDPAQNPRLLVRRAGMEKSLHSMSPAQHILLNPRLGAAFKYKNFYLNI